MSSHYFQKPIQLVTSAAVVGACLLFGFSFQAKADLINLDINGNVGVGSFNGQADNIDDFSGSAVLGGGTWTHTAATGPGTHSFSSLQQSDATPTSVSVSMTNIFHGWAIDNANVFSGFGQPLMRDYLFLRHNVGTVTSTITISGLNTMADYQAGITKFNIALYGSNRDTSDASSFTIGGTTKTVGVTDTTSGTEFLEGVDYAIFTALADSAGTITATWSRPAGSSADSSSLAGIQIESVPEPGSGILMGMLLVGYCSRRQKS